MSTQQRLTQDEAQELVQQIVSNLGEPHTALMVLIRALAEADDANYRSDIYLTVRLECMPFIAGIDKAADAALTAYLEKMMEGEADAE